MAKWILGRFTYPYIRRTAGAHGHFGREDYVRWLEQANRADLAIALKRLA